MLALSAMEAPAQGVPDHLQCYKVTNATLKRLKGVVDLDASSMGLAPGCKLATAKFYCVPAKTALQPGTLFDGTVPVTDLPYHGPPAETDRLCYRVTCQRPTGAAADQIVTDEFGTHDVRRLTTEMVCTPAARAGTLPPPPSGVQLKTPDVDIDPGQNVTYCHYFRTSNSITLPVKRWVSEMGPAARQLMLFTTVNTQGQPVDRLPPGTVSAGDCDFYDGATGSVPNWLYSADTKSAELSLPADDGAGNPVAIEIPPNSSAVLMVNYYNPTGEVVKGSATVNAEALDAPIYTRTATLTAYNGSINVPPQTNGYLERYSCPVPAGIRFWRMSMHTHPRATRMNVADGATVLFESLDWEHPGARTWAPPFLSFASGKLTYGCTYNNPYTFPLRTGGSYQSEEQCVAVGYFLPATQPRFCYDGYLF